MGSNEFRYLSDNECSKQVPGFCKIRCFSFVSMLKKTISKKLDPYRSIVASNNESEVSAKKDLGWVRGVFSCANELK